MGWEDDGEGDGNGLKCRHTYIHIHIYTRYIFYLSHAHTHIQAQLVFDDKFMMAFFRMNKLPIVITYFSKYNNVELDIVGESLMAFERWVVAAKEITAADTRYASKHNTKYHFRQTVTNSFWTIFASNTRGS